MIFQKSQETIKNEVKELEDKFIKLKEYERKLDELCDDNFRISEYNNFNLVYSEITELRERLKSSLEKSLESDKKDLEKLKSDKKLAKTREGQQMISSKISEIKFLKEQIQRLSKLEDDIKMFQKEVNKKIKPLKGKVGEDAIAQLIKKVLSFDGDIESVSNEQDAYSLAQDFFQNNSTIERYPAIRNIPGGNSYKVDIMIMSISREDVANWQQGKPCKSIYLVFESKTDGSELTKIQARPDYPQRQAEYMSNYLKNHKALEIRKPDEKEKLAWEKIEIRRKAGNDLLKACQDDRVYYFYYKYDTKNIDIDFRKFECLYEPKGKFRQLNVSFFQN